MNPLLNAHVGWPTGGDQCRRHRDRGAHMPLTFDAKYMAFRLFSSVLNPA